MLFEVGKKYRFRGLSRPTGWNSEGRMDAFLDGKPRKCIEIGRRLNPDLMPDLMFANFEGVSVELARKHTPEGLWLWDINNFEEA